jgi:hypothetical protein
MFPAQEVMASDLNTVKIIATVFDPKSVSYGNCYSVQLWRIHHRAMNIVLSFIIDFKFTPIA